MDEHYFMSVSPEIFNDFVEKYTVERLRELNDKNKQTPDYRHLGAGLLVYKLRHASDRFTTFVPPQKTKAFKSDAYAVTEDLGIEGKLVEGAFEITKVQKHSDAYALGIRRGNRILSIDGHPVLEMNEEQVLKLLKPEIGKRVKLFIWLHIQAKRTEVTLESKPYFKETVEMLSPPAADIIAIKITHFNQKTAEDFAQMLFSVDPARRRKLVIDLRGNGGGPPLAAREILGYFTPVNDPLFTIARKKQKPVMLTSPITKEKFTGMIDILVDETTASAAEMMSGVLQAKKLARIIGHRTAGATYLKSIYDFSDGSMIFMITSLTFFFDRRVFPSEGLTPDILLTNTQNPMEIVTSGLSS